MTPELGLLLSFGLFLLLIVIGMPVPFAILVPAMAYLYVLGGWAGFKALGLVSWANLNSFTLTAVPLFLFMAELMQRGGLTDRVYRGLAVFFARVPGRLLQTNIAGCAVFAAVSGSSVATAAAIGTSALPELMRRGYSRRLSAGSLAAGGTLGVLLPPSLGLIIYATFTETSVVKLFMGGVVPGLVLAALFMSYIGVHALLDPASVPREAPQKLSLARLAWALGEIGPVMALMVVTLGSIYFGLATPTEAASVGCVGAIVLSRLFGTLTWGDFNRALRRTMLVVGNILFLIFSAFVFSHAISFGGVGENVTQSIVSLHLSKLEFFGCLFVLFTVLGCLVESVGMIVITVPLLFPVLPHYGIDPVWFGIVLVLFIEMGQISPPIGINLFVIQSLWRGSLQDVVLGTVPFHILMFVLLAALLLWPDMALWLPRRV